MKIDFTQHKLHLVITPLDMRLGFNRLYEIALVYLHIDVKKGRDLVAFVSKNRKIAQWTIFTLLVTHLRKVTALSFCVEINLLTT